MYKEKVSKVKVIVYLLKSIFNSLYLLHNISFRQCLPSLFRQKLPFIVVPCAMSKQNKVIYYLLLSPKSQLDLLGNNNLPCHLKMLIKIDKITNLIFGLMRFDVSKLLLDVHTLLVLQWFVQLLCLLICASINCPLFCRCANTITSMTIDDINPKKAKGR